MRKRVVPWSGSSSLFTPLTCKVQVDLGWEGFFCMLKKLKIQNFFKDEQRRVLQNDTKISGS